MKPAPLAALLLTVLAAPRARAFLSNGDTGSSAAQFLKLGVSARADALGGAYGALGDDWAGLAYNPALLSRVEGQSLGALAAEQGNSIRYNHLAWAGRAFSDVSLGANFTHLSYGSIAGYDSSGRETPGFSPRDVEAGMGAAFSHAAFGGRWAAGLGLKWLDLKITQPASTWAADVGGLYERDRAVFAVSVQNLGGKIRYLEETVKLPVLARLATAYRISPHWQLALDVVAPNDAAAHLAAGAEWAMALPAAWKLYWRMGVNTESLGGFLDGFQAVRLGVGVERSRLCFDYAFVPMGSLGIAQRVSLGYRFGGRARPAPPSAKPPKPGPVAARRAEPVEKTKILSRTFEDLRLEVDGINLSLTEIQIISDMFLEALSKRPDLQASRPAVRQKDVAKIFRGTVQHLEDVYYVDVQIADAKTSSVESVGSASNPTLQGLEKNLQTLVRSFFPRGPL